ncbi:hypothetical protein QBC34DRAFT_452202 [Podospora aff. communis PSN243]|uniref:DUF8021 domain-containing protein n=1 Tax=Podospora aff. communis PSN243 TaxID=3040156 RepID=A0AAV9GA70_9PEZI|nr:hypothetical protein QBC34DRAFT_452202 [Podospora aff. communis PSN243]
MKPSPLLLGLPALTSASCTRAALKELTNRYIAAQSLAEPRYLTLLTPTTLYHENFKPVPLSSGILSTTPLAISHHRSIHDPTHCATYTEIIVAPTNKTTPASQPYVIGTQIWLTANGTAISKIDSIVTTTDDWLFNAQHTLYYALRENWLPVPTTLTTPRDKIQAAGDAYLDLFKNGTGSVEVPWGTPCHRLEGGLYTAPGDTCNSGVPSGIDLKERRYVIDEVLGVVSVFLVFGGSGLPDSHEFRVEGGRIRYVHTITKCWEKNCGFGDPPEILGTEIGF